MQSSGVRTGLAVPELDNYYISWKDLPNAVVVAVSYL